MKRRYAVRYYSIWGGNRKPDSQGACTTLAGARGTVARHLAREDYFPKALIIDRFTKRIILKMSVTADGIRRSSIGLC